MGYLAAFDISSSGMEVQKARMETIALNLANVNTTQGIGGGTYQPKEVVIREADPGFEAQLMGYQRSFKGAEVSAVSETNSAPRLVHDPDHPHADSKGMVAYPDINPVAQMVNMMETTRAYEANIKAFNASKTMALKALEIGK
ncbi:MAG: flagellar basal body rod protein FlgC [Neptuniibacter sp.]